MRPGPRPDWHDVPLAHRGRFGPGVPENSLPAMAAAVDAGDGVEIDVRVTADGVPVVVHDDDLARTTGAPGRVSRLPADAVVDRPLRALGEPGPRPGAPTVPTLAAALDLLAGRAPVMVELKVEGSRVAPATTAVARVLDAARPGERCVASFNPLALAWFRRHRPGLTRVLTVRRLGPRGGDEWVRWVLGRTVLGRQVAPHGVSVGLVGVRGSHVARWREAGGALWTWTVRDLVDLRRARVAGATPIHELAELPGTTAVGPPSLSGDAR